MKNPKLLLLILSISFLAACGGGGSSGDSGSTGSPGVNVAPVASAGANQSVMTSAVVTLDASASSDANGDSLTYAWSLAAKPVGSSATLSSSTAVKPTFTADIAGSYVASVIVNDGKASSAVASVMVTASVSNAAPVANAGVAQNVMTGAVVTLDGSASADANGDSLTYAWMLTAKPAGSNANLSSATSPKPTFTADLAGTYAASLTVNDGKINSANVATVSITASTTNAAPVANAGVAQNVVVGTVVTLDGSASSDANGDALTYAWTLTVKPSGSAASLSSATSAKPTFSADVAGTYVASLMVNDGKVNSNPSTISITAAIANVAPIANAGASQNVLMGAVVNLDGSASSDANSDPLTYAWTLASKPAGSAANLTSPASVKPNFTADVAGTYIASLTVNDGKVNSNAASVSITVASGNVAPVANAGVAQNVVAGVRVTLDGSASSDANGDPLTYLWILASKPNGSAATLVLPYSTVVKPTFLTDIAGNYVASLVVNDGKVASSPATVTITAAVENVAPIADAGGAQVVVVGTVVTLDGRASSDANNDPLTYSWSLSSKPAGSSAVLANFTSSAPTFTADIVGVYVASLVVNDGKLPSSTATVAITVTPVVPQPLTVGAGLFVQSGSNFYRVNESTGATTMQTAACSVFSAADKDSSGYVLAVSDLDYEVKEVDPLSGVCRRRFALPEPMHSIAVAADGSVVTVSTANYSGTSLIYRFSPTGVELSRSPLSGAWMSAFTSPKGIAFAPDGKLFAADFWGLWVVDPVTGKGVFSVQTFNSATSDIDIDSKGILRYLSFGVLMTYDTATQKLNTGSMTDNSVTFSRALIYR